MNNQESMQLSDEDVLELCRALEESREGLRRTKEELAASKASLEDKDREIARVLAESQEREKYLRDMEDSLCDLDAQLQAALKTSNAKDSELAELKQYLDKQHRNKPETLTDDTKKQIDALEAENVKLKERLKKQDETMQEYEELLHKQQTDVLDLAAKTRTLEHQIKRDNSTNKPAEKPDDSARKSHLQHAVSLEKIPELKRGQSSIYTDSRSNDLDIYIQPSLLQDDDSDGLETFEASQIRTPTNRSGPRVPGKVDKAFYRPREVQGPEAEILKLSSSIAAQSPPPASLAQLRGSSFRRSRRVVTPLVTPDTIDFDVG